MGTCLVALLKTYVIHMSLSYFISNNYVHPYIVTIFIRASEIFFLCKTVLFNTVL